MRYAALLIAVSSIGLPSVAHAAKTPKPLISAAKAEPSLLSSGESTTITAAVSGAVQCTLSSSKPVAGLPLTVPCESGSFSDTVQPINSKHGTVTVSFFLTALPAGGKPTAKVKLRLFVTPEAPTGVEVSADGPNACARLRSGILDCWGENEFGEAGIGTLNVAESDVPLQVLRIADAAQVSMGFGTACAALTSGHVECWGDDSGGAVGNGVITNSPQTFPVETVGITTATAVASGGGQSCALLSSGHVDCWGANARGELGTVTSPKSFSDVPVEVTGLGEAVQVATGHTSTCAVLASGHVDCWGENAHGQLGDGSNSGPESCEWAGKPVACSRTPVEVPGITGVTEVSIGESGRICALLQSGVADCWGENVDTPTEVPGLVGATQIDVGSDHMCALVAAGHVECLGNGTKGQLGGGTMTGSSVPVEAVGIAGAIDVSTGEEFSCATLAGGHIDCWGSNFAGELGNGDEAHRATDVPAPVVGID